MCCWCRWRSHLYPNNFCHRSRHLPPVPVPPARRPPHHSPPRPLLRDCPVPLGPVAVGCQQLCPSAAAGLAAAAAADLRHRERRPGGAPPCCHVPASVGCPPNEPNPTLMLTPQPLRRASDWHHPLQVLPPTTCPSLDWAHSVQAVSVPLVGSSCNGCRTWPPDRHETDVDSEQIHRALLS